MEIAGGLDTLSLNTASGSLAPLLPANLVTAIIIGGGGYGTAAVDPADNSRVIKFFKQSVTCKEAAYEFGCHENISTVFREFMVDNKLCKIKIPMPASFKEVGGTLAGCHEFSCSYAMDWIRSSRPDKMQQHTLLDADHQGFAGMIMFASHDADSRKIEEGSAPLTEEEMTAGRPRGEYFGIKQMIGKFDGQDAVEDIAYRMGILYGIVMAAGYAPKDVEVVIDEEGNLAIYDFGMVFVGEIEEFDADVDMYTPKDPACGDADSDDATALTAQSLFCRYRDGHEFVSAYFAKKRAQPQP